jgi:hypothetical protein
MLDRARGLKPELPSPIGIEQARAGGQFFNGKMATLADMGAEAAAPEAALGFAGRQEAALRNIEAEKFGRRDIFGITKDTAASEAAAKAAQKAHMEKASIPIKDVIEQRRALDDLVYREVKSLDPNMRAAFLREYRSEMREVELQAIERATTGKGEELRTLGKDYQRLTLYEKALENTVAGGQSNRTFSLGDRIAGGIGAMIGGGAGALLGGLGVPLGGAVGDMAGNALGKLGRERGNAAAAVLLHRLSRSGAIQRAMAAVDLQVDRAARGLFAAERESTTRQAVRAVADQARPAKSETLDDRFKKATGNVYRMSADPQEFAKRMEETGQTYASAPQFSSALTRNAARAAGLLIARQPAPIAPPSLAVRPQPIPDHEKSAYLEYYDAVVDPSEALGKVAKGEATKATVDGLRDAVPRVYQQLQQRILEHIADHIGTEKAVPYDQRVRLGMLFSIPADPSLDPASLKILQQNVASPPAAMKGGSGGPTRPLKNTIQQGALDRLEGK